MPPDQNGDVLVTGNVIVSDTSQGGGSLLDEQHCPHCQALLFKSDLREGSLVEIKCRSCGKFVMIG